MLRSDDPRAASASDRTGLLAEILKRHPRLAEYSVTASGTDWLELELTVGSILFAFPSLWADPDRLAPHLAAVRTGRLMLVVFGTDDDLARNGLDLLLDGAGAIALPLPLSATRIAHAVDNARERLAFNAHAADAQMHSRRDRYELDELASIGRALSAERDIDRLLALVLAKTRHLTGADAGTVYVIEDAPAGGRRLRFKVAQNDSVLLDLPAGSIPLSEHSVVGRCVVSREVIHIPDLYRLDEPGEGNNPWGFRHNRALDEATGYQTRSVLSVPLTSAKNEVIGVIQLINRKRRAHQRLSAPTDFEQEVVEFDEHARDLATTVASQAAVALENAALYSEITALFEGFVRASVTAIEQRDPTTSGHSQRVADFTLGLARAADRIEQGPLAAFRLTADDERQIEYAALLHDFGKVAVREDVLLKAKKLYEPERQILLARFDYVRATTIADAERRKVRALGELNGVAARDALTSIDRELAAAQAEYDDLLAFILAANEPTVLASGSFERLDDIARKTYRDPRGNERPLLTPGEVTSLQIRRGSLTPAERVEIESHVVHTYEFLKRIPWGRQLAGVPEIAGAHHEKLDGSGYPNRIYSGAIPVAARMMTIADIYDALTAADRPYKRAVPLDTALAILEDEVKAGKCDPDLFRLFVDARVHERGRGS